MGRVVLQAIARSTTSALAGEWADRATLIRDLEAVYALLLSGLRDRS